MKKRPFNVQLAVGISYLAAGLINKVAVNSYPAVMPPDSPRLWRCNLTSNPSEFDLEIKLWMGGVIIGMVPVHSRVGLLGGDGAGGAPVGGVGEGL